eukprot:TRINITY_DN66470_c4_g5_i2.p1 TRINITY_DN66470_c4_g5~~TRINITY_DN66470_c4_g5_i2.p1  ORF type:complete len:355 (+),score=44.69 TRINITY_DN66470_c4_g5_i2:105-1169(+)
MFRTSRKRVFPSPKRVGAGLLEHIVDDDDNDKSNKTTKRLIDIDNGRDRLDDWWYNQSLASGKGKAEAGQKPPSHNIEAIKFAGNRLRISAVTAKSQGPKAENPDPYTRTQRLITTLAAPLQDSTPSVVGVASLHVPVAADEDGVSTVVTKSTVIGRNRSHGSVVGRTRGAGGGGGGGGNMNVSGLHHTTTTTTTATQQDGGGRKRPPPPPHASFMATGPRSLIGRPTKTQPPPSSTTTTTGNMKNKTHQQALVRPPWQVYDEFGNPDVDERDEKRRTGKGWSKEQRIQWLAQRAEDALTPNRIPMLTSYEIDLGKSDGRRQAREKEVRKQEAPNIKPTSLHMSGHNRASWGFW